MDRMESEEMILPIDEKYRIKATKRSWDIQVLYIIKGEEVWKEIGFHYSSLESCVNGLAQLMLRTSDAETLAEALEEVKRVSDTLSRALSPEYEVTAK